MVVPQEILMINREGRTFRAHISECDDGKGGKEYLYDPRMQALQYRVQIPGIKFSMITQDVTLNELRQHLKTGKPVLIKEAECNSMPKC